MNSTGAGHFNTISYGIALYDVSSGRGSATFIDKVDFTKTFSGLDVKETHVLNLNIPAAGTYWLAPYGGLPGENIFSFTNAGGDSPGNFGSGNTYSCSDSGTELFYVKDAFYATWNNHFSKYGAAHNIKVAAGGEICPPVPVTARMYCPCDAPTPGTLNSAAACFPDTMNFQVSGLCQFWKDD